MRSHHDHGGGRYHGALAVALALCVCAPWGRLSAQDQRQPSPRRDYQLATLLIFQNGQPRGSGVLVGVNSNHSLGYVLTASDAVAEDDFAGMQWPDGSRSAGGVISRDEENGLAIISCRPPEGATVARLARDPPGKGEPCDHTSCAPDGSLTSFFGQYMHDDGRNWTSARATEEDLGGGVWTEDGKLLGVIIGGRYRITNGEDANFPICSASLDSIRAIYAEVSTLSYGEVMSAQSAVPPNYFEFLGAEVTVEAKPRRTQVTVNGGGIRTPGPPPAPTAPVKPRQTTPETSKPPEAARGPQRSPDGGATVQVVSIDTDAIARAVTRHIIDEDMMPAPRADAEFVIRVADRLSRDKEFVGLVAAKIAARVENTILERIGEAILDDAKP